MLPAQHKLTSPAEFRRTIKGGKRAGTRTVVVHFRNNASQDTKFDIAAAGPRFGLVVSKAVGNAVVRHRTSRRLRHVCRSLFPDLPPTADLVIRALPASATASSEQLEKDIRKALRKCGM
ncbi:ribonuclease P protein component [Corynebacterium sp. HMSC08C04]|uniref:ribonuclease P protein component n=1 Tax=Corynebacterium TaxID=1716 RepID=UPI000781B406|nr:MULTISPECIES: ribonuclease P protein component [Corynebacterium]OFM04364.1 ribonuclease P protein component [Corynebacterium sp. HMSC071F07]OFT35024.1 ribonuclease P protein component [Corynebacterium sp. HMSC08C04]OFT47870.1 ribonuclease P protein component [Corynebacterium sp. HMSC06G04]